MSADPMLLWAICAGALPALGIVLLVAGSRRRVQPLAAAMASLDGSGPSAQVATSLEQRIGAWAERALGVPLAPAVQRRIRLKGQSAREFAAEKLIYAGIGLVTPAVVSGCAALLLGWSPLIPAGAAGLGAFAGFFVPDLVAQRENADARADALEALLTYFDLVTLERLANQSAPQSLASAASLSDTELFAQLRHALERARLEQRPPYADLTRLAEELDMPELADVADVMKLDETGAALSGALRARVRELRDAHLARERVAAQTISERMTVWMTIPSLVFALIFLVPPLLRLVQ